MNEQSDYLEKVRSEIVKEAHKAHLELWNKYAELYKKMEADLEDTNLTKEQKRSMTKLFDNMVWR